MRKWGIALVCFCWVVLGIYAPVLAQNQNNEFAEAEISKVDAYVGEQIIYTLRIYSNVHRAEQASVVLPDFTGFWKNQIEPIQQYALLIDGQSYNVIEHRIALFPVYAQSITIEPAAIITPGNGVIGGGSVLYTEPVSVNIHALPQAETALNFYGGVGQFELSPMLSKQVMAQGGPITLTLAVRGTGNIEQISAPVLQQDDSWHIRALPATYVPVSLDETGMLIGEKTFSWQLTPMQSGELTIPVIDWWYFDVAESSYKTLTTAPVTVYVTPVSDAQPQSLNTQMPDIVTNIPHLMEVDISSGTSPMTMLQVIILCVLPPLLAGAGILTLDYIKKKRANTSEALRKAAKQLASSKTGQTNIITAYIASCLQVDAANLTQEESVAAVQSHTGDKTLAQQIKTLYLQLDWQNYSPDISDTAANTKQIIALLTEVDRKWQG